MTRSIRRSSDIDIFMATMSDLVLALEALGLGSYEPAFAECEYDDLAEIISLDDRGGGDWSKLCE